MMLCEWEKQIGGDFLSAGSHETECGRKTSMHGDRHHPAPTKSEATGKPGTNPRTCYRVIEGRLGEGAWPNSAVGLSAQAQIADTSRCSALELCRMPEADKSLRPPDYS